jgi:hypothetical protein
MFFAGHRSPLVSGITDCLCSETEGDNSALMLKHFWAAPFVATWYSNHNTHKAPAKEAAEMAILDGEVQASL